MREPVSNRVSMTLQAGSMLEEDCHPVTAGVFFSRSWDSSASSEKRPGPALSRSAETAM
ncbi:hypothetical protein WA016_03512 [Myxococcus stipitatus]